VKAVGVVVVTVVVNVVLETTVTAGMLMKELQNASADERAVGRAVRAFRRTLSMAQTALRALLDGLVVVTGVPNVEDIEAHSATSCIAFFMLKV